MSTSQKEKIAEILRISPDDIKDESLPYYYLKYPQMCCQVGNSKKPMFTGISKGDFHSPVKKLAEYYRKADANYLGELEKNARKYDKELPSIDGNTDQIALYYLMCRPLARVAIFWDPQIQPEDLQIEKGHIFYRKLIKLSKKGVRSFLYQMYGILSRDLLENVSQRVEKIYPSDGKAEVIFFESPQPIEVSGVEQMGLDLTVDFNHTILTAKMVLNDNSLDFLEEQDLERFSSYRMRSSRVMVNSYLNWHHQHVSLLDSVGFLHIHGIMSYAYGMRGVSDIDVNIYPFPEKKQEEWKKTNSLHFLEILYTDHRSYQTLQYKNRDISEVTTGVPMAEERFFNPRAYFYFFGLKIASVVANCFSRQARFRPSAFAEIIAQNNFFGRTVCPLPPLPTKLAYKKNLKGYPKDMSGYLTVKDLEYRQKSGMGEKDEKKYLEPINQKSFLKSIQRYLKTRFNLYLEIKEILELIPKK